jgi:Fe-S-cluster containining protein
MDDDHLSAALQQLAADSTRALQGTTELQQQFETLMEIVIAMGTLKPGHAALIGKLRKRVEIARTSPVVLASFDDKYAIEGDPIDCDSRLHLCQARCCSFTVHLARQDLEEGELAWEIDHPYRLPRAASGYCANLGGDDGRCQRYEHRPATCRVYTCREDRRVWLDFDARIPAPMPATLIPPSRLLARRAEPPAAPDVET